MFQQSADTNAVRIAMTKRTSLQIQLTLLRIISKRKEFAEVFTCKMGSNCHARMPDLQRKLRHGRHVLTPSTWSLGK